MENPRAMVLINRLKERTQLLFTSDTTTRQFHHGFLHSPQSCEDDRGSRGVVDHFEFVIIEDIFRKRLFNGLRNTFDVNAHRTVAYGASDAFLAM